MATTTRPDQTPSAPEPSQAERAYEELRDLLVTLEIRPGEPLREADLRQRLSVGRTPLREAVNRLVTDRLLVVHPRRGSFASDINIGDLALLTDLRTQLEGLAARRAAERATMAECDQLRVLATPADQPTDPFAAMRHDATIHRVIWTAAHNPFLAQAAERHHALSTRIWYVFVDRLPAVTDHVDELRVLVEHILDGDGDRAAAVAQDHVRHFEHAVAALW